MPKIWRNNYSMQHAKIGDFFINVQNEVYSLKVQDDDNQFRKRVIGDIKHYWRTLVGEETKHLPKDWLAINENILKERLGTISGLIAYLMEARKNNNDTNLIVAYKVFKNVITEGWFSSNLKEILSQTLKETISGIISVEIKQEQRLEDLPKGILDPITNQIVHDPVLATDRQTYERKELEDHLARNGGLGKAASYVIKDEKAPITEYHTDSEMAALIGFFGRRITSIQAVLREAERKEEQQEQLETGDAIPMAGEHKY